MAETKDKKIKIMSFGYKYEFPAEVNFLQDVRFLPNPFYVEELRDKTGRCKEIQEYVTDSPVSQKFLDNLKIFITDYISRYFDSGKDTITIAIGCTGGRHRSVAVAEYIYEFLKNTDYNVSIYHRDIEKG